MIDITWDWAWGGVLTLVVGKMVQMFLQLEKHEKSIALLRKDLDLFRTTPMPSDGTPEAEALKGARDLAKRMGLRLTFEQALKVVTAERKRTAEAAKGAGGGLGKT